MTKKLIFLVLALTLVGCNDRLDQYRILQKAYPNAQIRETLPRDGVKFLVVDTNGVSRVVCFGNCTKDSHEVLAEIPTQAEKP